MRVGILCLMQESNTFLNQPTEFHHFEDDLLLTGESIREQMGNTHHEVAGFLEGLELARGRSSPSICCESDPVRDNSKGRFQSVAKNDDGTG